MAFKKGKNQDKNPRGTYLTIVELIYMKQLQLFGLLGVLLGITSLCAQVPLDTARMNALEDSIWQMRPPDIRGVVVRQHGEVVWEMYCNSWMDTNILDIRSAGKSVTAMLAVIAVDMGLIDLEDRVVDFFPEYAPFAHPDPQKDSIRVVDLLRMASGLAADAYDDDSPGNENYMAEADDYVEFILDLPMAFNPGERYVYNSAAAMLMGAIVEQASGMPLSTFADKHLFGPLGITGYYWQKSPKGRTTGMGNLYLNPGDMAKIGQLMLQQGKWEGKQLISAALAKKCLATHLPITGDSNAEGYGYLWYTATRTLAGEEITFHFASGNGGNKIYLVPELSLVVSIGQTAYGYGYGHWRAGYILQEIILAALTGEK